VYEVWDIMSIFFSLVGFFLFYTFGGIQKWASHFTCTTFRKALTLMTVTSLFGYDEVLFCWTSQQEPSSLELRY
jgi:hypothetical protein